MQFTVLGCGSQPVTLKIETTAKYVQSIIRLVVLSVVKLSLIHHVLYQIHCYYIGACELLRLIISHIDHLRCLISNLC